MLKSIVKSTHERQHVGEHACQSVEYETKVGEIDGGIDSIPQEVSVRQSPIGQTMSRIQVWRFVAKRQGFNIDMNGRAGKRWKGMGPVFDKNTHPTATALVISAVLCHPNALSATRLGWLNARRARTMITSACASDTMCIFLRHRVQGSSTVGTETRMTDRMSGHGSNVHND